MDNRPAEDPDCTSCGARAFDAGVDGKEFSFDIFWNAHAVVADGDDGFIPLELKGEGDTRAGGAEFDGIVEQVDDDTPELVVVYEKG